MGEGELEDVMVKFIRHDADILVCTTIIESGLDIPNANTIFINNADRFGLSELHQLRGRVGRWKHRAYCYLLLPSDRPVTPVAAKRLKAIEEYSHLGAGFKIAMRDLEIRGAGNILGPEQSGHIATVGYEMYCQLLEEATRQLKNDPKPTRPEAHVDIGISAFIPKTYIPADRQRMDVYRRLTRAEGVEMLAALENDVKDAFGELPRQAVLLFALTEVRLLAQHFGVSSIIKKDPDVILTVSDAAKAQAAMLGAPGTLRVIDEKTVYLRMPPTFMASETLLMVLKNLMRQNYDKLQRGELSAQPGKAPEKPPEKPVPPQGPVRRVVEKDGEMEVEDAVRPAVRLPAAKESKQRPTKPAAANIAAPSQPAGAGSFVGELEKLLSLRKAGILTEEEFQAAKKRLLATADTSTS
jgi:transcription-repair coupling factor (superfamily II helicase)